MNVLDAARERIRIVFAEFENVYVSFSGGKDSGVLLNLAIDHLREFYQGRRMGVFHIDYEAQYQMTTDYVDAELSKNLDVLDVFRICLPLSASCATSMTSASWIPWDRDKEAIWVRSMPENATREGAHGFDWFRKGMWDYDFQERFGPWYREHCGGGSTACLVGIRTQESLNRWRAIHSDKNQRKYGGHGWTLDMGEAVNAYPIFDWTAEDVWTANAKLGYTYNKLYDLFWQAGVPLGQMRVASPFHTCGVGALKLYKVIDPQNWGRMIGRTDGVNFAGLYGGTTAMGWKNITLPDGHTWKSYLEFLLKTLPPEAANNYQKKLEKSQEFWRTKGGCLSGEILDKLDALGVPYVVGSETHYRTSKLPVRMEYQDDIDIPEFSQVPSYKRMCVCIIKNDHLCKFMGFSLTKQEQELRKSAEERYASL